VLEVARGSALRKGACHDLGHEGEKQVFKIIEINKEEIEKTGKRPEVRTDGKYPWGASSAF